MAVSKLRFRLRWFPIRALALDKAIRSRFAKPITAILCSLASAFMLLQIGVSDLTYEAVIV